MFGNEPHPILKCDKFTKAVVQRFPSVKEAAADSGLNYESVIGCANRKGLMHGRYYYRWEEDYAEDESFYGQPNRAVQIWDRCTGKGIGITNAQVAADKLGVARITIYNHILKQTPFRGRFDIKYMN